MKLVRRLYGIIKNSKDRPPRLADLEAALGFSRRDRHLVKSALRDLQDRGAIERLKGGRYALSTGDPEKDDYETVKGVYRRKAAGYGFVDSGVRGQGVFIPPGRSGSAMDRDVVEARVYPGRLGKGPEGKVLKVIKRNRALVAGTALRLGREWILEPDDPELGLAIDLEPPEKDVDDVSVIAEIIRFPEGPEQSPLARVLEVLGTPGSLDVESRKILILAGVGEEYPEEVLDEARKSAQVFESGRDETGLERRDLRDLEFITIDPEDARDFDDALFVEILENGFHRLWTAIADVSFFVKEGGPSDLEARKRGFSIYLPHRAVAMLPEVLSSGVCSLAPEEDRFAMVTAVDIDHKGNGRLHWVGPALIRSRARLDYGQTARIISGEPSVRREVDEFIVNHVLRLQDTAGILLGKRRRRGMLEITTAEAKVTFSSGDVLKVDDVVRQKQGKWEKKAYGLVEQCMLETNEIIGALLARNSVTTMWRIHPDADPERLDRFIVLLKRLGLEKYTSDLSTDSAKGLARVARQLAELPEWEAEALGPYLLSCLMQASYSCENEGHFALAAESYLHFTSPIRRYPDLMVHRALKEFLGKEAKSLNRKRKKTCAPQAGESLGDLEETAVELSERERRIVDLERQALDLFSCALMQSRVGEEFEGTVHSVMPFGAFVRLDHPYVEGLVRFSPDEEWVDDGDGLFFTARRSGHRIGPATRLKVRVLDVSLLRRQIELEFAESGQAVPEKKASGKKGSRKKR